MGGKRRVGRIPRERVNGGEACPGPEGIDVVSGVLSIRGKVTPKSYLRYKEMVEGRKNMPKRRLAKEDFGHYRVRQLVEPRRIPGSI